MVIKRTIFLVFQCFGTSPPLKLHPLLGLNLYQVFLDLKFSNIWRLILDYFWNLHTYGKKWFRFLTIFIRYCHLQKIGTHLYSWIRIRNNVCRDTSRYVHNSQPMVNQSITRNHLVYLINNNWIVGLNAKSKRSLKMFFQGEITLVYRALLDIKLVLNVT